MAEHTYNFSGIADAPPPPYTPPAGNARMGAAAPGTAIADQATGITLADFLEDPKAALWKSAQSVGRDLSDPKIMLPLLAAWAVPKMIGKAPAIKEAASRIQVNPGAMLDLKLNQPLQFLKKAISMAPKSAPAAPTPESTISGFDRYSPNISGATAGEVEPPHHAGFTVLRDAQGNIAGLQKNPTSPGESVPGGTAPLADPPSAAAPVSTPPPATPAAAGQKAMLSAPEVLEFDQLRAAGKTETQAYAAIRASRDIRERFGLKIPTKAETRFPKGNRGGPPKDE